MLKTKNLEAMIPTQKPMIMRKSDIHKPRETDHSSGKKKGGLMFPDSIREVHMEVGDSSPFKDHPLYSKNNELASSFSYS